jgi:hypothetical protein
VSGALRTSLLHRGHYEHTAWSVKRDEEWRLAASLTHTENLNSLPPHHALPPLSAASHTFLYLRKVPAPKVKPESWTDERWQEDCLRQRLSTTEQRDRWVVELARKIAESVEQQKAALTACATATAASPWSCWSGIPVDPGFLR